MFLVLGPNPNIIQAIHRLKFLQMYEVNAKNLLLKSQKNFKTLYSCLLCIWSFDA